MTKTILLIDDDPDEIELFVDAMREAGFNFVFSHQPDAKKALASLTQTIPDYILLDYKMPKMNGLECLVKIKNIPSVAQVPVIMYSSVMDDDAIAEALAAGAAGCIKKPFDMRTIPELLKPFL